MDQISEIDKTDKRYIDYLKITDNPDWHGYQSYCWDLYVKEMKQGLLIHLNRNNDCLNEINETENFKWLQKFIKNMPTKMSRTETNNNRFNSTLKIRMMYDQVMRNFSKPELNKQDIKVIFNEINNLKKFVI